MDFYQQLQLSSIGSKQWIKGAKDSKEKHKRILIYNFKVYLVVAFCFAVVTLYSMIFGSQNSVVGVLVLLVLMILRQVDFGIDTKHSIGVIFMIFAILAVGPRLANTVNTVPAFFIHFLCIMAIMILSCHNVIMSNQSTFILGYLLFYGYDVTGHNYVLRCCGLFAGAVICSLVFYKKQLVFKIISWNFYCNVDRRIGSYAKSYVDRDCCNVCPVAIFKRYEIPCTKKRTI